MLSWQSRLGYIAAMSKAGSATPPLSRNIELKARLASLEAARRAAERLVTADPTRQYQLDTYFDCRSGRLKLREIRGQSAQLIWYARPDVLQAKPSSYYLVPVQAPETLKSALASALGVRVVVEKVRDIYHYQNVRIHLDQVSGLGCFLELEAVLDDRHDANQGRQQIQFLQRHFGISATSLVTNSYGEMHG